MPSSIQHPGCGSAVAGFVLWRLDVGVRQRESRSPLNVSDVPTNSARHYHAVEIAAGAEETDTGAGKFRQIMFNDLSHALKFSGDNEAITVRTVPFESDYARNEVEDRGPGIRPEDIHKLFTEFQRMGAEPSDLPQATGPGLALKRHISEAQGGWVRVASEVGAGSTFSVSLPKVLPVTGTKSAHSVSVSEARIANQV